MTRSTNMEHVAHLQRMANESWMGSPERAALDAAIAVLSAPQPAAEEQAVAGLAARAVPFLRDEGEKYEDDGSNEPLELAREIESALASLPPVESALPPANSAFDGGRGATPQPPAEAQAVYAGVDLEGGWIRATAPEAQAQGGGEVVAWRILWSPQFPEAAELTSDGVRVQKVRALDDGPQIEPLYTAPPSAPVGVDALRDARTIYDIACIRAEYANATREDVEFKAIALRNYNFLAQQPASDGGFTAADMMDARQEGRKEAQQPAAVDEAMVERATTAYLQSRGTYEGEVPVDRDDIRAALTAALAAQQPAAVECDCPIGQAEHASWCAISKAQDAQQGGES